MAKIEDFEEYDDGDTIADMPKWSEGPDHDTDPDIVVEVEESGGDKFLSLYDNDLAKRYDVCRTFFIPGPVGDDFSFVVDPTTAGGPKCKLEVRLKEDTTTIIQLWIDHSNGKIYYGAGVTDTGLTVTLDAENTVTVLFFSTTQFKIKVGAGAYTAALNNEDTIVEEINGVEFLSPDDNSLFYAETGSETFETYAYADETFEDGVEDASFKTGRAGWEQNLGGANLTATIDTLGGSKMGKVATDGATNCSMRYIFPGVNTTVASHIEFDIRTGAANKTRTYYILCDGAFADYIFVYFHTDGNIWCGNGAGDTNLQAYSADTTYHIKIYPNAVGASMHHFDIDIDSVNKATNQSTRYGTGTLWHAIEMRTQTGGAGFLAIDNIHMDWPNAGQNLLGVSGPIGDWSIPTIVSPGNGLYMTTDPAGGANKVGVYNDSVAASYGDVRLTFDSPGHIGDIISFDWRVSTQTGGQFVIWSDVVADYVYLQCALFDGDAHLDYYNTAHSKLDTGYDIAINTWYTVWLNFLSTTQFKIYVGAQGAAEPAWAGIAALDCNGHLADDSHLTAFGLYGSGANTFYYYVDNIRPKWTTVLEHTDVKPMTTYIDDLSASWIGGTLKTWTGTQWATCNVKFKSS